MHAADRSWDADEASDVLTNDDTKKKIKKTNHTFEN